MPPQITTFSAEIACPQAVRTPVAVPFRAVISVTRVSSKMRTLVKRVMTAAESGDKATAEGTLALAIQAVDKAAKTNVIHKNAAARKVSQLTRAVQKAGA